MKRHGKEGSVQDRWDGMGRFDLSVELQIYRMSIHDGWIVPYSAVVDDLDDDDEV